MRQTPDAMFVESFAKESDASSLGEAAKLFHQAARAKSRHRRMARCGGMDQAGRDLEMWRAAIAGGSARVQDLMDAGATFGARFPVAGDVAGQVSSMNESGATMIGPMERSALMGHCDFLAGAMSRGADPFAHIGSEDGCEGWRAVLSDESGWQFAAAGHHKQMNWLEMACSAPLTRSGAEALSLWLGCAEVGGFRAETFCLQIWTCADALLTALENGVFSQELPGEEPDQEPREGGSAATRAFMALASAVSRWESAAKRRSNIQGAERVLAFAERLSKIEIASAPGWDAGKWWAQAASEGRGPLAVLAVSGMGDPPAWVECPPKESIARHGCPQGMAAIHRWPLLCACAFYGSMELASVLEMMPKQLAALAEPEAVQGAALAWSRVASLPQARKLKKWGFELFALDVRAMSNKWQGEPGASRMACDFFDYDVKAAGALVYGLDELDERLWEQKMPSGASCGQWLFEKSPEAAAKIQAKSLARASGRAPKKKMRGGPRL